MSNSISSIQPMSAPTTLSMQQFQEAYRQLTGKNEKYNKRYDLSFQIELDHLVDLNNKILQSLEQFNVVEKGCAVKVYYLDDSSSETYSSFERFTLTAKTSSSAVEMVTLKYNFLIFLPKLDKPQNYEMEIRLVSRSPIFLKNRADEHYFPRIFFDVMRAQTAYLEINYVDFSVARTMAAIFESWMRLIPATKQNKAVRWFQRRSHHLDEMLSILFVIASLYFLKNAALENYNDSAVVPTMLSAGIFLVVFFYIGRIIGRLLEVAIDRYECLSYIILSEADRNAVDAVKKDNFKSVVKGGLSFACTLIIALLCEYISSKVM